METVQHLRLEELHEGYISVLALEFDHLANLIQLKLDKGTVGVTLAVNQSKNSRVVRANEEIPAGIRDQWQG